MKVYKVEFSPGSSIENITAYDVVEEFQDYYVIEDEDGRTSTVDKSRIGIDRFVDLGHVKEIANYQIGLIRAQADEKIKAIIAKLKEVS